MERLEELVAAAESALESLRAAVADAAQEAAEELGARIDALSTKVDEVQEAWAARNEATQLPAEEPPPVASP